MAFGLGARDAPQNRSRTAALWVFCGALVLAIATWLSGALDTLDYAFEDLATGLLEQERPSHVVIVEIDPRTLKELGRWPLPRSHHAQLLRNLAEAGAKSIFVDIDFSSTSTPDQDRDLADAIAFAGNRSRLILPAFWQPSTSDTTSLLLSQPLPQFRMRAELGLVNLTSGPDGLVRDVASFSELPSDAIPVWRLLNGSPQAEGALQLDYRISLDSFRRVSYVDVIRGDIPHLDANDIVFVGATALELGDMVSVPVHRALPGIVVQALAYESARAAKLKSASTGSIAGGLAIWASVCAWLLLRGRWRHSPFVTAALISIAPPLIFACYEKLDLLIPLSPFIVVAMLTLTGSLLSSLSIESWRTWWAMRRTHEQDALLRRVVDHSSDAILTLDAQCVVRTANRSATTTLGVPESQLVGRTLQECAPSLVAALHSDESKTPAICIERADGGEAVVEVSRAHLAWDQQNITVLTLRDVTEQRAREGELRHLALHDALTGLPNRFALGHRLDEFLTSRPANAVVALLMLDLDGFKEVNDTLGHSMGDELMRELGRRLAHLATVDRQISRLGGDEFAVLWRVENADRIGELAQQILLIVEEPILIKGIPVSLGTSIGVAVCPTHADDSESLLKRADVALYVAKRKHSRVEFYEPSDDNNSPRRLEMLTMLRAAVNKDELLLEYQPKICMSSGQTIEVEALCRWQSPTLGRVMPGEFIALAEASDVIKPLTEWTIRRALIDCRTWRERGIDLRVAVNLSARHLQDAQLPQWLEATFIETGTQASWLELEITESAIMTDPDRASRILRLLHELGVLISIDDFGTGYSSLAYLRKLAVDRLKLDRSFISGMDQSAKDEIIVESTIRLAHGLDLEVIAEGIETESQYARLRAVGCDVGQGYWIAEPMNTERLVSWYMERHQPVSRHDELFEAAPRRAAR